MNTKNIKNRNISILLLTLIIELTVISCNKQAVTPPETINDLAAQATTMLHRDPNDPCVVTNTIDIFGDPLDIFYNNAGDPDSMNYGGWFAMTMDYDNSSRLLSANFPINDGHYYFFYSGNSDLPDSINWHTYGGLQAIIKFEHNNKGAITKVIMNPTYLNGFGGYTEVFEYNNNGNITKRTITIYNNSGVLVTSYIENKATTFDNKKNFMGGNHWLKYILYNSGFSSYDYFRMLSKNNPTNYTWEYDGGFNPFHASYIYNNQGFANTANFTVYDMDGVTVLDNPIQTSISTCENNGQRPAINQPSKTFYLQQSKEEQVLPFTSGKR